MRRSLEFAVALSADRGGFCSWKILSLVSSRHGQTGRSETDRLSAKATNRFESFFTTRALDSDNNALLKERQIPSQEKETPKPESLNGWLTASTSHTVNAPRAGPISAREALQQLEDATPSEAIPILISCIRSVSQGSGSALETQEGTSDTLSGLRIGSISPDDAILAAKVLGHACRVSDAFSPSAEEAAQKLFRELVPHIQSILRAGAFSNDQLRQLLVAFGDLNFGDAATLRPILKGVESGVLLEGLSAAEITSVARALAELDVSGFYTLEQLTKAVLEKGLGVFSNSEIAALLYCAARIDWKNAAIHKKLTNEACRWDRLVRCAPSTVATICLSLGNLSRELPREGARLLRYLKRQDRITMFNSSGLSCLSFGLNRVGVRDPEIWKEISQSALRPSRLASFTEKALSKLINGLGPNVRDDRTWTVLAAELQKRQVSEFSDASLMTMITGLEGATDAQRRLLKRLLGILVSEDRLRRATVENLVTALTVVCGSEKSVFGHLRPSAERLVHELLHQRRGADLSAQSIALTVRALGRVPSPRLAPKSDLTHFVQKALHPKLANKMTSQGWACVIFGLGELRFREWSILDSIMQQISCKGYRDFSTFELCGVFFGLGKCGYQNVRITGSLLAEILSEDRKSDMNCGILTTLIMALSYHKMEDQMLMDEVLEQVLEPERFTKFSKKELSIILHSVALLQCSNLGALRPLILSLFPIRGDPSQQQEQRAQLSWLIRSLSKLNVQDPQIWKLLIQELQKHDSSLLHEMSSMALSNILSALHKVDDSPRSLTEYLLQKLLKCGKWDTGSVVRGLAAAVHIDDRAAALELSQILLTKCRIKRLNRTAVLGVMKCFLRARMMEEGPFANWLLTELLFFENGILFSRLSDQHLLQLSSGLQNFLQRGYPYIQELIDALKDEILTIRRRDSFKMQEMAIVMAQLKAAEESLRIGQPAVLPVL